MLPSNTTQINHGNGSQQNLAHKIVIRQNTENVKYGPDDFVFLLKHVHQNQSVVLINYQHTPPNKNSVLFQISQTLKYLFQIQNWIAENLANNKFCILLLTNEQTITTAKVVRANKLVLFGLHDLLKCKNSINHPKNTVITIDRNAQLPTTNMNGLLFREFSKSDKNVINISYIENDLKSSGPFWPYYHQ